MSSTPCYSEIATQYWNFEQNQDNEGTGSVQIDLQATGSISYAENDYGEYSVLVPSGSQQTFNQDCPISS